MCPKRFATIMFETPEVEIDTEFEESTQLSTPKMNLDWFSIMVCFFSSFYFYLYF